MVEQVTLNHLVRGSNPWRCTIDRQEPMVVVRPAYADAAMPDGETGGALHPWFGTAKKGLGNQGPLA